VPVILITGSPELGSAVAAVEYGAMTYLQKPVPLRQLVDTVQKALRLHQAARLQRQAAAWFQGSAAALSDRAGLDARFELALEKLWLAQQPIVRWSQKTVFARECLMRSDEATLAGPGAILEAAERLGRVHAVGRRVRERAAALFAGPEVPFLFVNLHPSDLLDDGLYAPNAPLSAFSRRVYLEVTERAALEGISDLRVRVERLRTLGYSIALDDLGAGYAGLNSLAHLEPELVKLDMVLVRNIDQKPTQRKLVSSMVNLCRDMRTDVIAEGVETVAERDVLIDLGCDLLQGYLFAKPARTAPAVTW
jgi:EAL domain-containing protein (putative c-di-GMP-specific phosphodiesterase class I)